MSSGATIKQMVTSACICMTNFNLHIIIIGGPKEDTRHLEKAWTLKKAQLVLGFGFHKAEIRVLAGPHSFLEALRMNHLYTPSVCWQNSVPHSCRTEVPVSLLAVN